jgi:hypothetical protein
MKNPKVRLGGDQSSYFPCRFFQASSHLSGSQYCSSRSRKI